MENELIVIEKQNVLAVFSEPKALDPYLQKIREEIDSFVPDVSSKKGRDAIASIAHKVARSKTYLDGIGKDLVAELKELPKTIDAHRKEMRDKLDAWKDEVRKPLTDWEAAEEARIAAHKAVIADINAAAQSDDALTSDELLAKIAAIKLVDITERMEEFEAEAHRAKEACLLSLQDALDRRLKYEAEQAELARLRAEAEARERADREARIAKEAEERARAQAELAAKAEREASERRELELKLQAERAEREKVEAQRRAECAAKETEERIANENARREAAEAAEIKRREADKSHKASINRMAASALVTGGLSDADAKRVITLIAKGAVPNVKINY